MSANSTANDSAEKVSAGADGDAQTETLDEEPRSILLGLISQLRKGMDLHRVTLPTFILEPRSMLERITDFMSHPEILTKAPSETEALQRFLLVVKYYLSGWHIRPKGVKKPYNPVLGEFFRCKWTVDGLGANKVPAFYVAEQVSHHPPVSAFYYACPENKVFVSGEMRPSSRFLGNSAASMMAGGSTVYLGGHPNEKYTVTFPNVYARGLLFGTMLMELGDNATVKCEANDLIFEVEFLTKGFFSGTYNGLRGKVKRISSGELLATVTGKWNEVISIQMNQKGASVETFFDSLTAPINHKLVEPAELQDEYESRKLWAKLTAALLNRNIDQATVEKSLVEDQQRKLRQDRELLSSYPKAGKFFQLHGEDWVFTQESEIFLADASTANARLQQIIWPKSVTS